MAKDARKGLTRGCDLEVVSMTACCCMLLAAVVIMPKASEGRCRGRFRAKAESTGGAYRVRSQNPKAGCLL